MSLKPPSPEPEVWGYAEHHSPESWMGAVTREEAEAKARKLAAETAEENESDSEGWIHGGKRVDAATVLPDAEVLIENMVESAFENGCPDTIEDPLHLRDGAKDALTQALGAWATQYMRPRWWEPVGEPIRVVEHRHGGK